jgi:hypothetical protein
MFDSFIVWFDFGSHVLLLVPAVLGLVLFLVELDVLVFSVLVGTILSELPLIFPWVGTFCFGVERGVIFLRGVLLSLEEEVMGARTLLRRLYYLGTTLTTGAYSTNISSI